MLLRSRCAPVALSELKADLPRARKVFAGAYEDAHAKWHALWLAGEHPCTWLNCEESLDLAFDYTLSHLPEKENDVNAFIETMIDNYIRTELADAPGKGPKYLDRGAKRRRRATIKQLERQERGPVNSIWTNSRDDDAVKPGSDAEHDEAEQQRLVSIQQRLEQHKAKTAYVLGQIKEQRLRLGLEMAIDHRPPSAIREATNGLRIPDLIRGWKKWCLILGVAA